MPRFRRADFTPRRATATCRRADGSPPMMRHAAADGLPLSPHLRSITLGDDTFRARRYFYAYATCKRL